MFSLLILDHLSKQASNSPACPGNCPSKRNGDLNDMDGELRQRQAAQILISGAAFELVSLSQSVTRGTLCRSPQRQKGGSITLISMFCPVVLVDTSQRKNTEQVPVTQHIRLSARLPARHGPLLRPSDQLHSHLPLITSLSPTLSYLLPRPDPMGYSVANRLWLFGIVNAGLKDISRSKQLGAKDEGADLTDDISVDISS
ncbi:unnamed protein product [Pleuronectes platessa]|uniref:Uncharacterized protein n=1 Tax=Pleuronectes platessa TaxID=8262 RepID=A0A9N7YLB0_PLEPL|nr:unnamed protein product [Pleuronectes platessa]